jgi:hypothetical protein
MTEQSKALQLADQICDLSKMFKAPSHNKGVCNGTIQELRRLHEVNQELLHWLRYIQVQTHIGHIHDTCSAAIAKGETT